MPNLPIDVVPDNRPLKFRWRQTVDALGGERAVDCEGSLPPGVEGPVAALITLARAQEAELVALRKQVEGHAESELLSKPAKREVMISLSAAAYVVLYLVIAAAVFGLLWWLITYVAALFPGEAAAMFIKVARLVLVILAVLVLIGLLLSMVTGQPVFRE